MEIMESNLHKWHTVIYLGEESIQVQVHRCSIRLRFTMMMMLMMVMVEMFEQASWLICKQ